MAQQLVHLDSNVRDVLSDGLDPFHEAGPRGQPKREKPGLSSRACLGGLPAGPQPASNAGGCWAPSTHRLPPYNERKCSGSDGWGHQPVPPSPGWRGSLNTQCTHLTPCGKAHICMCQACLQELRRAVPGAEAGPEFHSGACTGSARDLRWQRPFSWAQPAA